jgi:hypothetical protein
LRGINLLIDQGGQSERFNFVAAAIGGMALQSVDKLFL